MISSEARTPETRVEDHRSPVEGTERPAGVDATVDGLTQDEMDGPWQGGHAL